MKILLHFAVTQAAKVTLGGQCSSPSWRRPKESDKKAHTRGAWKNCIFNPPTRFVIGGHCPLWPKTVWTAIIWKVREMLTTNCVANLTQNCAAAALPYWITAPFDPSLSKHWPSKFFMLKGVPALKMDLHSHANVLPQALVFRLGTDWKCHLSLYFGPDSFWVSFYRMWVLVTLLTPGLPPVKKTIPHHYLCVSHATRVILYYQQSHYMLSSKRHLALAENYLLLPPSLFHLKNRQNQNVNKDVWVVSNALEFRH